MLDERGICKIIEAVKPFSMVCEEGLRFTITESVDIVRRHVPGHFVECGVWRGGCGIAMLLAQQEQFRRIKRTVHFLDSFAGLPPATEADGTVAAEWQKKSDNCLATREEFNASIGSFAIPARHFTVWQGWFIETLPRFLRYLGNRPIAFLRLDADWYDSTMLCLEALFPHVSDGATIIIDDYYAWDGCTRAVHDFLSKNKAPHRIKSMPQFSSAYFRKERFH